MKGIDKGLFPSKSAASPKFSSTGFEENDENDSGQENMTPNSPNYKKTVSKHFMSPTISAASKAASPRNKILAERNECSRDSGSQNHEMSNLDWKRSLRNCSDRFSSRNVDGDTKAYDPVKNFLSPRPKYLRFDPNRRREIFKRLRKEEFKRSFQSLDVSDEDESSGEETDDSSFCQESVAELKIREKTEDDEDMVEDEEEEDEEEEEERRWCLRGVLKFLFILIGCVLSTPYICSMNSPTLSQTHPEIWKNQTLDFVSTKMLGSGFYDVEVGDKYSKSEDDSGGIIRKSYEAENVEILERHDKELGGDDKSEDGKDETDKAEFDLKPDNFEQSVAAKSDEKLDAIEFSYTSTNENNVSINEDEGADIESKLELIVSKTDESEDVGGYMMAAKSDENVDAIEFSCTSLDEKNVNVNEDEDAEIESKMEGSLTDESEDVGGYVMATVREAPSEFQDIEFSSEPTSEETQNESKTVDEDLTDSVNEVDERGYDNEDVKEKKTWITSVIIGVLVVSVFSTSLALVYHSKKGRTPPKASRPMPKPHMLVVEEARPLVPCIERKVEFLARPSSLSYPSPQEAPELMNHHINAPSVELISEIVVGKVSRSSEKYKMTAESKESNATSYVEPASTEEHSSTSYGSFSTGRKRISKKEGESTIGATPVRRSNRLRNRAAVTSP